MTWSDLPTDLLCSISCLLPIDDFLSFLAVCASWNYVISDNTHLGIHCRRSPWLLLPNDANEASDRLTFYDIAVKEDDGLNRHRHLFSLGYDICGCRCIGSKDGWLVILSDRDLRPRIFNPLTKVEICLPPLFDMPEEKCYWLKSEYAPDGSFRPHFKLHHEKFPEMFFKKIVVSSNDLHGTAVIIYGYLKLLAFAKPNDQAWILIPQMRHDLKFDDVYYYKENQRFYTITHFSTVLSFDLNGQNIELICPSIGIDRSIRTDYNFLNYIFFLSGSFLKIKRETTYVLERENLTRKTIRISVLKLNSSFSQWISINDLEGFSLFIGCNQTFALHHKVALGIRPNCVYFTDNWAMMSAEKSDHDFGLFDLQNNCFQYFFDSDSLPDWPPSIWFMPSLPCINGIY